MKYGQFCPIAKATEILGEKWTLLILRELLMGGRRFSDIQRGLSFISPTLLTRRLKALEHAGLVIRKKNQGHKNYEYLPSKSAEELQPILMELGNWGMRWAKKYLTEEDYDVDFLMLYLQRSIDIENIPGGEAVIKFKFLDIDDHPDWWILISRPEIDICTQDPGKEVDVYFTTTVKTMTDVWLGHRSYQDAFDKEALLVVGMKGMTRNISSWLTCSPFSADEAS